MMKSRSSITPDQRRRRSRRRAIAWAALTAFAASFGLGQTAFAQGPDTPTGPDTHLLAIENTSDPVVIVRAPTRPSTVSVTVGDQPASIGSITSVSSSGRPVQTTIVVDNGAEASEYLDSFITAARAYVASAPVSEGISVWTTGGGAKLRAAASSDHTRVDAVLSNLVTAAGTNHMWDAVRGGVLDFLDPTVGATNLLLFAGSPDTESVSTSTVARGAVLAAGASAFVVSSDDPSLPLQSLARLVAVSPGGGMKSDSDPSVLAGYGNSVSEVVAGTWLIGFTADNILVENQIDIGIDNVTFSASYVAGSVTAGSALTPFRVTGGGGLPLLTGSKAKSLGILLGAAAAALAAYAMVMLLQKDPSGLDSTLMPYSEQAVVTGVGDEHKRRISKNLFVKRAVQMTEDLAERQGVMSKWEALLERADLPLRVGEALSGYAAIAIFAAVFGLLLGKTIMAMIFFGTLGLMIPPLVVKMKAGRRRKKFMNQLPDTLQLLSSTLKAGYSFMQGVDAVSQEIEDPMAGELRRIVAESQLGRPVEEAMDSSAERMDSNDFAWAVMAVKIQREVGGNLSELLLTVAETMTERERLRRDVASLTAEGKMSAIILGALPILLGFAMWAMNKEYIELLFTDSFGKVLLVVSAIAALAGFAWMKKIITIEI